MEENAPHCGSSGNAINDELELSWWYESWRRHGRGNGQQSPLYVACDRQDMGWVRGLLSVEGMRDDPGPSGITAFALSIGMLNNEQVLEILKSGIEPRGLILNTARKFTEAEVDKDAGKHLQNPFGEYLNGLDRERILTMSSQESSEIDEGLVTMSQKFPFINEMSEIKSTYFDSTKALGRLPQKSPFGRVYFKDLDRYVLGDMCINSPNSTWNLDDVSVVNCHHISWSDRSIWCELVQDMVQFAKLLQERLRETTHLMTLLKPTLTLVGSIAEGTRIGFSNELDIMVNFDGWNEQPPFTVDEESAPLLRKSRSCQSWMDPYFDEHACFRYHFFKEHFLESVDSAIKVIYESSLAPKRLVCLSSNTEFSKKLKSCQDCKKKLSHRSLFIQCRNCIVTTSQTKMGACLQFEWKLETGDSLFQRRYTPFYKLYCSIDLVPIMTIESGETSGLQRTINIGMLLKEDPTSWFKQLRNFVKEDRLIEGLPNRSVDRVLLKTSSCKVRNNYFVRAGQLLGKDTFKSENLRKAYCYIKGLKKAFALDDISMFRVKKMFHLPLYLEIGEKNGNIHDVVHDVLLTPEFKPKFEGHIDFGSWREGQDFIPLIMRHGRFHSWIQALRTNVQFDALSVPTFSLFSSDIVSIVIPAAMLMAFLASREMLGNYHFSLDLLLLCYIKFLSFDTNPYGPNLLTMYMACNILKVGIYLIGYGTPYKMGDEHFIILVLFLVSSIAAAGLAWHAKNCVHTLVRNRVPSFEKIFIKLLDFLLIVLVLFGQYFS